MDNFQLSEEEFGFPIKTIKILFDIRKNEKILIAANILRR